MAKQEKPKKFPKLTARQKRLKAEEQTELRKQWYRQQGAA